MPFQGTIAAMEIYVGITEGDPGPVKKEIMKALCRDYGVDMGINPMYDHRSRERAWFFCIGTTKRERS